ncbi:MAG: TIGR03085 family metal-binding protein [Nocardioides sp.]
MTSFARRERLALCDTALRVGPDAPTLCDPWDTRMLVCHLLVRERHPIAATGITVGALEGLTRHAMDDLARGDFGRLVEQFRTPGVIVPFGWPGVEQVVNRLEHFIHHEDIRRAAPAWTPRTLDEHDESSIWTALKVLGRALVRPAGVPVRMEWGSRSATLRGGEDPVVLSGLPSELALALHGRARAAQASCDGPPEAVARLREADLGV